jgi:hypothetical protein
MFYDGARYGSAPSILNQGYFGESDVIGTAAALSAATPWGGTGNISVAFKAGGGTNEGLEIKIPFAALLGVTNTQTMKVFAAITNDAEGAFNCAGNTQKSQIHFSDEFLPNLGTCGNKGADPNLSALSLFSNAVVLPVDLTNVSVKSVKLGNEISWETASERNNALFNIQRSPNSQAWQTIGSIKATNSLSGARYYFTDDAPLSTINYYRLQMVDSDGKMDYSKIVSISNNANKKALAVYPNPAKTELNLVTDGNMEGVTIMDLTGRTVRQFNGNSAKVDIADLPNGVYFVRLLDKNGLASEHARFVKQ